LRRGFQYEEKTRGNRTDLFNIKAGLGHAMAEASCFQILGMPDTWNISQWQRKLFKQNTTHRREGYLEGNPPKVLVRTVFLYHAWHLSDERHIYNVCVFVGATQTYNFGATLIFEK